jgi:hypothetical protein
MWLLSFDAALDLVSAKVNIFLIRLTGKAVKPKKGRTPIRKHVRTHGVHNQLL